MKDKVREAVKKFLGIEDPLTAEMVIEHVNKQLKEQFKPFDTRITESVEFVKKIVEVRCYNCGIGFLLYPFGGGYYTSRPKGEEGHVHFHNKECLDKYIEKYGMVKKPSGK